ncbi:succinate-semialdehyde dehydrogenase/glutarate-semialdehyde dehydrogenase [Trinickia symbiotica]|uniref:NAD-dependent succinate-semialdehyde dehydrogenase n=1 Tax=Trinickia symbiotica TaxID=863227 RepID=A0A2N7WT31_9BURK|nr:NAD-dependent succinate-semialdehyde dehydrogenase [Trinickia symbiotica]PMS32638.1 NAD-dependent succinate-semialdehyde dehydrogenase [Trinickia symbiotica]PPK41746.1 succinate-semialdehyde dehydrogenase/glutarate-semialdehyde dehydrogenase [Trinickia symbiotica]
MHHYPDLKLFIGGAWKTADGEPVLNPADDSVLGTVPHATRADLDGALAAAQNGFKAWSRLAPAQRAETLGKAAQILRSRADDLAVVMTLEQGKPVAQARQEVMRTADMIEWEAQEGRRLYGRVIPSEPGMRHTVLRQPIGVVAAFSPWNFPTASPGRKVAAALSAGCSIILKASEETPASAFELVRAFEEAGVPAGVVNLVFGNPAEISEYLIPHPTIRVITLTGSVAVGKRLTALAGEYMKPAIMELGGHAPVIVCDDVDAVASGTLAALGKSRNAGQVCTSPTRFYVEDAVYEPFIAAMAEKAMSLKVGNGLDPDTDIGPLANARRVAAIEELVADARQKGARLLAGGERLGTKGNFYPLTVLADVPDDARAMREEPFGPLALVSRVRSIDEAIEKANSLPFGLAGYGFTNSARKANQLYEELEVGNLAINHFVPSIPETPFGGVKDSGIGREGGEEGLHGYTVVKNISHLMS